VGYVHACAWGAAPGSGSPRRLPPDAGAGAADAHGARSTRKAAEDACFHNLKGLELRPLTPRAKQCAIGVLKQLSACLRGFGYETGPPVVRNMSRGRAFFGFTNPRSTPPSARLRLAQHTCEKRVILAGKLDRIIARDRSGL
jgi:hypothetical protein